MSSLNLPAIPDSQNNNLSSLESSAGGDYLGYIALCGSNSKPAKMGKIDTNNYAYIKSADELTDLGKQVDVFVIADRPLATDFSGEQPKFCYHPRWDDEGNPTGEFLDIQNRAGIKDGQCQFGIEYLLYIPEIEVYAKFYCGNKSSRRESPKLRAKRGQTATLSSKFVDTGKYQWQAIEILECSTPLEAPEEQSMLKEYERFVNVPEPESAPQDTDR